MTRPANTPKVTRDGKVAVLVSYGYGAGWSTWCSDELSESAVFCPELVEWVEGGKKGEPLLPADLADEYQGGLPGVRIEWVDQGERFHIDEYDGAESLVILGPDYGYLA